jgi:hypothetical protein
MDKGNLLPQDFTPMTFWERPEGTMGMVVAALLGVGGIAALYKLLPYLVSIATNTLTLVVTCVALAAILYVVFDPRFRTLIAYAYKSLMRWITGLLIEIDPIGILKNYISDLRKSKSVMDARISDLASVIQRLKNIIQKNEREAQQALKIAQQAQKVGNNQQLLLQSRQHGRLEKANMTYLDLEQKSQFLFNVLTRYQEYAGTMIADMEEEVRVETERREMTRSAHGAMSAAMRILKGQDAGRDMYNASMEYLAVDYASKIGQIEDFVRVSESFVSGMDLENGVFEADAMKKLEEWERSSNNLLMDHDTIASLNPGRASGAVASSQEVRFLQSLPPES